MAGEKFRQVAVGLAIVGAGAAALAANRLRAISPHLVRTMGGLALVYVTHEPDGEPVRLLRTGGVFQSATYLGERWAEPAFAYYRAFGRLFDLRPDVRRVLAIGGGGFAFPKLVAAEHPGVTTDVVEIDPAVVRIARRWFFLDEAAAVARSTGGDLCVHVEDGRAFLERASGPYDAVVLDAFMGEEPVRSLVTVEALEATRAVLAPNGAVLANVVSRDGGSDVSFLRSVTATACAAFAHVAILPCTDDAHAAEDNYLVIASDAPLGLPDAIGFDEDFLGPILRDEEA